MRGLKRNRIEEADIEREKKKSRGRAMKRELRGRGGRGADARRAEEGWCKRVKIRNEKTRKGKVTS